MKGSPIQDQVPGSPRGDNPEQGPAERPTALVVGAGVSGCACAAALAQRGVRVTVVSSALDTVGLPAYGPVVTGGATGWADIAETMRTLPAELLEVWLNAAAVPDDGAPLLTVDRRMISVEAKRALERMPGLGFRQGLVTDIRVVPGHGCPYGTGGSEPSPMPRVTVGTVFGEVIEADAVVLAVGLSLGGHVFVGADVLPGGRYGETAADGLRTSLDRLGATYRETRIEVGARFSRSAPSVVAIMEKGGDTGSGQSRRLRVAKTIPARTLLADGGEGLSVGPTERDQILRALETSGSRSPGGQVAEGHQAAPWPVDYPPAPQWSSELWLERIVFCDTEPFAGLPLISPDGVATGEVCTSSEGALGRGWAGNDSGDPSAIPMAIASRLHHAVAGLVITGLAPGGRLEIDWCPPPPIWLTGRAAGAGSYLESLRSGVEVGAAVAAELTGRKVTTRGEVQGSARRSCVTDARPDSARVAGERGSVAAEDESGVGRERG